MEYFNVADRSEAPTPLTKVQNASCGSLQLLLIMIIGLVLDQHQCQMDVL